MASASDLAGALAQQRLRQTEGVYDRAHEFGMRTQLSQQEFLQKLKIADYEATRMRAKVNAENFIKIDTMRMKGQALQWGILNPDATVLPPEIVPYAEEALKGQDEARKALGLKATTKAFRGGVASLSPEEKAAAGPLEVNRIGDIEAETETRALERELGPVLAGRGPEAVLADPAIRGRLDSGTVQKLQRLALNLQREGRIAADADERMALQRQMFDFRVEQAEASALDKAERLRLAKANYELAKKWFDRAQTEDQKKDAQRDLVNARAALGMEAKILEASADPYMKKDTRERLLGLIAEVEGLSGGMTAPPPDATTYKTPGEVREAVKRGEITEDEAVRLIRNLLGGGK